MNRLTPEQRFQVVQFYFENNGSVRNFHERILFSDEAHFWFNGYINKQNCRIWSEANPQVYVVTPLHPEKLFGALYGLVESFFKNDEGHNVTVNGDRYRAMITNFSFLN
ncbi:tc3a_0 protein [Trichonephila clavipes]|nr:tc3a_0 protein [Trichonephila clavipes]